MLGERNGRDLRILAVIPAYNEEGKVGRVISRIPPQLVDGIIVVDDCSTDQTRSEAKEAGAVVVRHDTNLGVGAAIRSGIDYALSNGYDVVAILSGDDQHDPDDLPGLLRPILEQGYDFVQGSRRLGGLRAPDIGWFRRILTWLYALIFRMVTGFPCTDATNGARAFRVTIFENEDIDIWQDWLNGYELEPYLLYKVAEGSFRVAEAPARVVYHDRGTTKMRPVRDWWRIFRPMVFLALRLRR